jgi:hypothetical protein
MLLRIPLCAFMMSCLIYLFNKDSTNVRLHNVEWEDLDGGTLEHYKKPR